MSYLQDTNDLLRALDGISLPGGAWLVALDVEALYNSIPHQQGVEIVKDFLSQNHEISSQYNGFILNLLMFILSNNIFLFGGSHYLQIQGVAMGTKCAPSYANLYLGGWERELFSRDDMQQYMELIPLWRRFIDNIFFIWVGPKDLLLSFLESLKTNRYNLKFTVEFSQSSLNFLDTLITVKFDGSIRTTLYRKPSAGNSLLHANSSHPTPLITSVPYGQYLRAKRNCSDESDFEKEAKCLHLRFLNRGYSKKCLKKAYLRAKNQNRASLLHNIRSKKANPGVRLITTYSSQHKQIRDILNKYWYLLMGDRAIMKTMLSKLKRMTRAADPAIVVPTVDTF